ncbi:hypothetical protein WS73_12975 [Burkholderia savannae]|uniref:hypothetical protein n=1 Tax=Burkholderia savannae TaxID=1637837 RepID=UPI000763C161|nr:hypothetical protein [Burkholderia savannae]KWZ45128.1 hypothetical protein WS73_12975 [Burkholderia savannae]
MTQMILDRHVAPARRASAVALRLVGFAIAGSGAAVLIAQAARHLAAAAGG